MWTLSRKRSRGPGSLELPRLEKVTGRARLLAALLTWVLCLTLSDLGRPRWPLKEPHAQVPGLGQALDGSVAALFFHRGFSSGEMPQSPHGPTQPFQELNPVQAHSVPRPSTCLWVSWRQSLRTPSAALPSPRPAWSWLLSLPCSQVAASCDVPSPSGSITCRSDYLSDPQNLGMDGSPHPTPPLTQGQRAVLCPLSHGAARPALAKGPPAAPLRPDSLAGNQPVWPWKWTYLYYCEVLFMKNLEGEGARPQEMVVVFPSLSPARHLLPWPL